MRETHKQTLIIGIKICVQHTHDIVLLTETLGDKLFDMNVPNVESVALHISILLLKPIHQLQTGNSAGPDCYLNEFFIHGKNCSFNLYANTF